MDYKMMQLNMWLWTFNGSRFLTSSLNVYVFVYWNCFTVKIWWAALNLKWRWEKTQRFAIRASCANVKWNYHRCSKGKILDWLKEFPKSNGFDLLTLSSVVPNFFKTDLFIHFTVMETEFANLVQSRSIKETLPKLEI